MLGTLTLRPEDCIKRFTVISPPLKSSRPGYLATKFRTRNIIFKANLLVFGLWLKERGIFLLKRVCFDLWLKERGILHLKCTKWVESRGLSNPGRNDLGSKWPVKPVASFNVLSGNGQKLSSYKDRSMLKNWWECVELFYLSSLRRRHSKPSVYGLDDNAGYI